MAPSSSSRKIPPKTGAVVVAVVALVVIVVLRMDERGGAGPGAVPAITFQTATVKVASMGKDTRPAAAQAVFPDIREVVGSYYQQAFLNPANWKSGTYDSAWGSFTPAAAARAEERLDVLTLGADAGDTYEAIQPEPSLLGLRVLTNEHGKPVAAYALVTFAAEARTRAGDPRKVISVGRFALEPAGSSWRISGFRVSRKDDTYGSSPTPTAGTGDTSIGLAHPAEHFPAHEGSGPLFFLVIGDSYRAGQSHLADSLHVVALDPGSGAVTVLGIPRDSWVPVPGHGTRKINEAFALGGPELMIDTVEQLTGLQMDYYATTTFGGFIDIIKGVGGLDVKIPYAIHDSGSKANLERGRTTLSGKEALRLARSRYDVPNGDFSRQYNEGLILLALLEQFQRSFRQDPSVILNWLGAAMRNVDTDLSWDQVMALAYLAVRVEPAQVTNLVVPGKIRMEQGQSAVLVDPSAEAIFEDLSDGRLDAEHAGADV